MATFDQAGKWMAEGKQVRRSTWNNNGRIGIGEFSLIHLYWGEGETVHKMLFVLSLSDFETDTWEIFNATPAA